MTDETHTVPGTSRRVFLKQVGLGAIAGGAFGVGGTALVDSRTAPGAAAAPQAAAPAPTDASPAKPVDTPRVAADPTKIPPPIHRSTPKRHEVVLEAKQLTAEIEPGVTFDYMTFGGQIPGPMIRVRQGDTVRLTLRNPASDMFAHNVDLHAVYGPGGGNVATTAAPGQSNGMEFKAMYPGAFIYHCAVPNLDWHISAGMFGMILVEPPDGLRRVDHEFYLGQNEIYTVQPTGQKGHHDFDFAAMTNEDPTYVLLNGEKHALTAGVHGPMKVEVGETARVFFVCGGPNLTSSFHPIGNVWTRAWYAGALAGHPQRYVQTMTVPPGSCGVFEMDFPVPGDVKLVDHALSRVVRKGMLGIIHADGTPNPAIFNPKLPGDPA
ncbi:MAG: copper-containing nitrite reductase [Gemmatimonadetes bacterium]|nr:copper-containing nitrite reductase [Gemmatimonadota bacterium]